MKILYKTQHPDGVIASGLVDDKADLANVPSSCIAGSRFHTAGYLKMWEKGEDGNWHIVIGEDE